MKHLKIITDGSYSSSRDQGGLGIVILLNNKPIFEHFQGYKHTTNNQMELGAVIIALRKIINSVDSITIITDSQWVIGCASLGWKRNKNLKLWKEYDKQFERVSKLCPNISFKHVKGHQSNSSDSDSSWNNYVDKLAVKGSKLILK